MTHIYVTVYYELKSNLGLRNIFIWLNSVRSSQMYEIYDEKPYPPCCVKNQVTTTKEILLSQMPIEVFKLQT